MSYLRALRLQPLVPLLQGGLVLFVFLFFLDRYNRCNPYVCGGQRRLALDPQLDGFPEYRARWTPPPPRNESAPDQTLVLASMLDDDTSWVREFFPDWQHAVYVVDDPGAAYAVPANKGREGMVYLTYIIDHYDQLPSVMVFYHAMRYQWHNDDPMWDGVPTIQNLRHDYVREQGYANLRCTWRFGCPAEIKPHRTTTWYTSLIWPGDIAYNLEAAFAKSYLELFPDKDARDVPTHVGTKCGAQFALSRDAVRAVPLDTWRHVRAWLLATPLTDTISGRIMEHSWHQIVGKPAVLCPDAGQCFCETFGLCNLTCPTQEACHERYQYPVTEHFPKSWPTGTPTWWGWPDAHWRDKLPKPS